MSDRLDERRMAKGERKGGLVDERGEGEGSGIVSSGTRPQMVMGDAGDDATRGRAIAFGCGW